MLPVFVIVKVSLLSLVAIEIPVPAAKVNVSVAESATILVWPLTAIFLNAAVTVPDHIAAAGKSLNAIAPKAPLCFKKCPAVPVAGITP